MGRGLAFVEGSGPDRRFRWAQSDGATVRMVNRSPSKRMAYTRSPPDVLRAKRHCRAWRSTHSPHRAHPSALGAHDLPASEVAGRSDGDLEGDFSVTVSTLLNLTAMLVERGGVVPGHDGVRLSREGER